MEESGVTGIVLLTSAITQIRDDHLVKRRGSFSVPVIEGSRINGSCLEFSPGQPRMVGVCAGQIPRPIAGM